MYNIILTKNPYTAEKGNQTSNFADKENIFVDNYKPLHKRLRKDRNESSVNIL